MDQISYAVKISFFGLASLRHFFTTQYKSIGIAAEYFPKYVRLAYKLNRFVIIRPVAWIACYFWTFLNRSNYDLAVVPWDNKMIYYAILRGIESITVHNTTNFIDLELELAEQKSKKDHFLMKKIESIFKVSLMPRFMEEITRHGFHWYIDKLMGMRSSSLIQGFSGIELMTVTGDQIKKNLTLAGLNNLPSIHVIGNPSYEGYLGYARDFSDLDGPHPIIIQISNINNKIEKRFLDITLSFTLKVIR